MNADSTVQAVVGLSGCESVLVASTHLATPSVTLIAPRSFFVIHGLYPQLWVLAWS